MRLFNFTITTIVFDLGGVLVDWKPEYLYSKIFSNSQQRDHFLTHICTPDWNEEQDAGRSLEEGTESLIKKFPQDEIYIRAFYMRWQEMLGGPIHETVEIFRQLKQQSHLKFYALTNWSAETFPIALQLFDFFHWFDGRMVSGEEKTRKPFPEIYRRLITRFNIQPQRAIYIDDNLRNLPPAKALGFHTIHFQTAELLKQALNQLGL